MGSGFTCQLAYCNFFFFSKKACFNNNFHYSRGSAPDDCNDFIFDTEIIAQGMACSLTFQEVPIVTRYFPEASSINFRRSVVYGFGILAVLAKYWLHWNKLWHYKQFEPRQPA